MPYISPSIEDLLDRYPEFAGQPEDRITAVLQEAEMFVGESWIPEHRLVAVLALTAHLLYSDMVDAAKAERLSEGGELTSGPLLMKSVGPITVRYDRASNSSQGASSSSSSSKGDLRSTPYGARFLQLQRASFPPVVVLV